MYWNFIAFICLDRGAVEGIPYQAHSEQKKGSTLAA